MLDSVVEELGARVGAQVVEQAEGAAVLEEGGSESGSVLGGGGVAGDVVTEEVDYDEKVDVAKAVHGSHRRGVDAYGGVFAVDLVVEGQGLVVVDHAEARLLAYATGSYGIFDEAIGDVVAREQLVHVEPGAAGAWVAHLVVMRLPEEDPGIREGDSQGGEGLERRRRGSVHAGEPVCKAVLSAGDVADEEHEGGEVGAPAHDLGDQGVVHPAEVVMVGLDDEGLAVEVVAQLLDAEEDGLLLVCCPAGGLLGELVGDDGDDDFF